MGILDLFRSAPKPVQASAPGPGVVADGSGVAFYGLSDPALVEYLRRGNGSSAGIEVTVERAMKNPAVFRSVSLVSESMGMLPTHVINKATKEKAKDLPLYKILHRRPNEWQTAYDFKTLLQLRALVSDTTGAGGRQVRSGGPTDVEAQPYFWGSVREALSDYAGELRSASREGL